MASVGLKSSPILCSKADLTSSVDFPLIDFAFMIVFYFALAAKVYFSFNATTQQALL